VILGYGQFYDWLVGMDTLENVTGLKLGSLPFVLDVDYLEGKEMHSLLKIVSYQW
jgi:hypothetical protein